MRKQVAAFVPAGAKIQHAADSRFY